MNHTLLSQGSRGQRSGGCRWFLWASQAEIKVLLAGLSSEALEASTLPQVSAGSSSL